MQRVTIEEGTNGGATLEGSRDGLSGQGWNVGQESKGELRGRGELLSAVECASSWAQRW